MYYPDSELIINADGSAFHLHLRPEQLADKVILVGDPGRVKLVASFFDTQECEVSNREFHSITGVYKNKRLTVVSTGIGCDNIDIVVNELDALANIDFSTREDKPDFRKLDLVRIGTSGGIQENVPVGSYVISKRSIGFDGLLNFYGKRDEVADEKFEKAFVSHMQWTGNQCIAHPYVVSASEELTARLNRNDMIDGITIACGGFYGPQGRRLRIPLADPRQNEKIRSFRYENHAITNFEMESSALAGLSAMMGHNAVTVCLIIANRFALAANTDYHDGMEKLIQTVLDRI